MKYLEARRIIRQEFPELNKEDKSQFNTLVELLIKYGEDNSRPIEAVVIVPKLKKYRLIKWSRVAKDEPIVSLSRNIFIGKEIYKLRDELNNLTHHFEAQ